MTKKPSAAHKRSGRGRHQTATAAANDTQGASGAENGNIQSEECAQVLEAPLPSELDSSNVVDGNPSRPRSPFKSDAPGVQESKTDEIEGTGATSHESGTFGDGQQLATGETNEGGNNNDISIAVLEQVATSGRTGTTGLALPSGSSNQDIVESMSSLRNVLWAVLSHIKTPVPANSPRPSQQATSWGNLISEYSDQAHVQLSGSCFTIGRSSRCNLQLQDPNLSGLVCRIYYNAGAPVLESCTSTAVMLLNNTLIRKGLKLSLRSGDQLVFSGTKVISFVFQLVSEPIDNPSSVGEASRSTETPLLPDIPGNAQAEKQIADGTTSLAPGREESEQRPASAASTSGNKRKQDDSSDSAWTQAVGTSENILANVSNKRRKADTQNEMSNGAAAAGSPKGEIDNRDSGKTDSTNSNGGTEAVPLRQEKKELLRAQKLACRQAFQKMIIDPDSIEVTFSKFPYHLTEDTKQLLLNSAFPFLKATHFLKYIEKLPSMSRCILLTGPPGTEIYQDTLVRATCKHLNVNLLVFDVANDVEYTESISLCPLPLGMIASFTEEGNEYESEASELETRIRSPALDPTKVSSEDLEVTLGLSPLISQLDDLPNAHHRTLSLSDIGTSSEALISEDEPLRRRAAKSLSINRGRSLAQVASGPKLLPKMGDRITYVGATSRDLFPTPSVKSVPGQGVQHQGLPPRPGPPLRPVRGPKAGDKGRVVLTFTDNIEKLGVEFDNPIAGGNNLGNRCKEGHGFFVHTSEVLIDNGQSAEASVEELALEALFEAALGVEDISALCGESQTSDSAGPSQNTSSLRPCVILIRDTERVLLSGIEHYMAFKRQISKLPLEAPLLVIGSSISLPNTGAAVKRERLIAAPQGLILSKPLGGGGTSLLDFPLLDTLNRMEDRMKAPPKSQTLLNRLFPTKISLHPPRAGKELDEWKAKLALDIEKLRCKKNVQSMRRILAQSKLGCDSLPESALKDTVFTKDDVVKLISWAASYHMQMTKPEEITVRDQRLILSQESIAASVQLYNAIKAEASSVDHSLKDVVTENEFERRLLQEAVISRDEISVRFEDVGALEKIKSTLHELVMLPLRRPELFQRGQLTTPVKGILLFGPPGTGKTMLAKAVAGEAGAHFLALTMSTIASKWFGEGEKYVKAVFALASKIAPTVIFIDEVDSLLGKREKQGEHEAMRKIKNEFMSNWDGLRTKPNERVLVLAATNRPFDLDDAVLRRFPRRLLVDLPNAENRNKILRVILKKEELDKSFSFQKLASDEYTGGFSGSDLKNLCIAAAYQPIRKLLKKENELKNSSQSQAKAPANPKKKALLETSATEETFPSSSSVGTVLRPITMKDFDAAKKEVSASMPEDSFSMQEIRKWNDMYGEGGSRQSSMLSYFM